MQMSPDSGLSQITEDAALWGNEKNENSSTLPLAFVPTDHTGTEVTINTTAARWGYSTRGSYSAVERA